jgi:hypothetical protein
LEGPGPPPNSHVGPPLINIHWLIISVDSLVDININLFIELVFSFSVYSNKIVANIKDKFIVIIYAVLIQSFKYLRGAMVNLSDK